MKEIKINENAPKMFASFKGKKGVEIHSRGGVSTIQIDNKIVSLPSKYVSPYDEEVFESGDKIVINKDIAFSPTKLKAGTVAEFVCYFGYEKTKAIIYFKDINAKFVIETLAFSKYKEEEKVDKKLLLPVGTELELIKKPFGTRYINVGMKAKVIDADDLHVYVSTEDGEYFSLNKMDVEENWKVIVAGKWDESWSYCIAHHVYYKRNGKRVKVKYCGEVGYSRCSDEDVFDLSKGIKIAMQRAKLKRLTKKLNKGQEEYHRLIKDLRVAASGLNSTKVLINSVEAELDDLTR